MNFYHFMNEVVFAFIEGIVTLLFFVYFIGKSDFVANNKLRSFLFSLWYMALSYWVTANIPKEFNTPAYAILTIILISLITKSNVLTSIIGTMLTYLALIVLEAPLIIAAIAFLKLDLNIILSDPQLKFILTFILRLLQIIVLTALYRSEKKVIKLGSLNRSNSPIATLILQIFVISILLIGSSYASSHGSDIKAYTILQIIICLLFIFTGYIEFKEREQSVEIQKRFSIQEQYVKNLETVIEVIRKEKHDFSNHLSTLMAMCVLKRPDAVSKIEEYIKQLGSNLSSSYKFYSTGNTYIDGLLAVKSNYAQEKNIHLDVSFDVPLTEVAMDDIDLTSIIGNIVDNAFDAILMRPRDRKGNVSIYTYIHGSKYYISISNTGISIPRSDLHRIFENRYSTKRTGNKSERGYGLYITKQLVKKYNGNITVTSTDNETEFLIQLDVKNRSRNAPAPVVSSEVH